MQRALELGFARVRTLESRAAALSFLPGELFFFAFSCHRPESSDRSLPGDPHGLLAPFARRNHYGEAVARLKLLVREIAQDTGIPRRRMRIFCNSDLPEKRLAFQAGLGFYGKNSLIIAPGLGSLFVIAGLYVPVQFPLPETGESHPEASCGSCRACIDACPTNALSRPGRVDRSLCLQALSTDLTIFPKPVKKAWGFRLYGCQVCQDVCPFNRNLPAGPVVRRGELGSSLSLRAVLEKDAGELHLFLRGSVLDRRWIAVEAIQRNALLAAGNRGDPRLRPTVEAYRRHTVAAISDAAAWAARRMVKST